jgi:hypothetical protein
MAAPVLVGSIESRPLRAIENLRVFNDLKPSDLGVTSVLLNIYFGIDKLTVSIGKSPD